MIRFIFVVLGCAACGAFGCMDRTPKRPEVERNNAPRVDASLDKAEAGLKTAPVTAATRSLDGTWGVDSAEQEGAPRIFSRGEFRHTYAGSKLRFGTANQINECQVVVDSLDDPPHHDVIADNRVEQGIFRIDGDVLTICAADSRKSRPDTFATSPGDGRTLMVFRRMQVDKLGQPVSKAEAEAFAQRIEKATKGGDTHGVNSMIDLEGMLDRVTQGFGISKNERLSFIYGLKVNSRLFTDGPQSLGGKFVQNVAEGGSLRSLRVENGENSYRVLCRLVTAKGGLTYNEFILGRDAFGNAVATDVFMFNVGEALSATTLRGILPYLLKSSPDGLQRLSPADQEYIRNGDKLREYALRLQAGELDEAEKIYQQLPGAIRSEKFLMIARLANARAQDRSRVLEECLALHRGEPVFALLAMEEAINRADKDAAFEIIAHLEHRVGNDAYLNLMRASACKSVGDLDGTRRFTAEAFRIEPDLRDLVEPSPAP
jgi:uncharacterized protein (TIGR03067 family)